MTETVLDQNPGTGTNAQEIDLAEEGQSPAAQDLLITPEQLGLETVEALEALRERYRNVSDEQLFQLGEIHAKTDFHVEGLMEVSQEHHLSIEELANIANATVGVSERVRMISESGQKLSNTPTLKEVAEFTATFTELLQHDADELAEALLEVGEQVGELNLSRSMEAVLQTHYQLGIASLELVLETYDEPGPEEN